MECEKTSMALPRVQNRMSDIYHLFHIIPVKSSNSLSTSSKVNELQVSFQGLQIFLGPFLRKLSVAWIINSAFYLLVTKEQHLVYMK